VTGVVVIVAVVVLAIVAGTTSAKTVTVAEAADGNYSGAKVQVTGKVVDNSFSYSSETLSFSIYDETGDADKTLKVVYDKGVSTSFGNQITATCTGVIDTQGILQCSELLTQCPSKYEGATDALTVKQMSAYGAEIIGKPVKVTGTIKAGSMKAAGQGDRFVIVDDSGETELPVAFEGALSAEVKDGAAVVVSGALSESKSFMATDVALRG
jgi:cytochrome c-type biogenesis protein CcmE